MEVHFQRLVNDLFGLPDQICTGIGGKTPKGVDHGQGVHMPLLRHAGDQVDKHIQIGSASVDGEENRIQSVFLCAEGCVDRRFNGFLVFPLVGVFHNMLACGYLHHDVLYSAVHRAHHVLAHAPGENKDFGPQVPFLNLDNRFPVRRGYGGHARFYAVHSDFGHLFGQRNFLVFGKQQARLLFPVPEGYVMKLDLFGKIKLFRYVIGKIPWTCEPFFLMPGCLFHFFFSPLSHSSLFTQNSGRPFSNVNTTCRHAFCRSFYIRSVRIKGSNDILLLDICESTLCAGVKELP
ncbi:hypothetical protein SDC9_125818 [bioreactor metagenome]|uniref:Uncharacterized protein n=1 Tax=bioreactor metagenome TaxID=1076179 RepID=A0A645CPK3_9ZZZZ